VTHDPTESALLKWAPRRVRNNAITPMPTPPCPEPRATITEADLLRGYSVNNLAAVGGGS